MRKIVLVYLLMIALPAVLVALGGLHLVRREVLRLHQDEQAYAAQAGTRLVARAQKELPESVSAPVRKGDAVGVLTFRLDGGELGRIDISAAHDVDKISFGGLLLRMLKRFFLT